VAAGQTALDVGDCDAAMAELDRAIAKFGDHGPALASRADARLCTDDDDWLISPPVSRNRVDAAIADWRRAAELGVSHPWTLVQVAWLHTLQALDDPGNDAIRLRDAATLSEQALETTEHGELPGAHFARLNAAFTHLALQDEGADRSYRDAVVCLSSTAECPGGGFETPELRDIYRLLALDDLELLAPARGTSLDRYREIIAKGAMIPAGAAPEAPVGAWTLDVFPQELQIEAPDGVGQVAVVWYYRGSGDDPWDVIWEPSLTTTTPDWWANRPLSTAHLLPTGDYRADVYVADHVVHVEPVSYGMPQGYERVVVPDLGFQAVVPEAWEPQIRALGKETAYTAPDGESALVLGRREGIWPDVDGDLEGHLDHMLDDWVTDEFGHDASDGATASTDESWYLGLGWARFREYPAADTWAAVGFAPYATDPGCGGTVYMTMITGHSRIEADLVYDSLLLDPNMALTADTVHGSIAGEGWTIVSPEGWVGVHRPPGGTGSQFATRQCETGASAALDSVAVDDAPELAAGGTLDDVVDDVVSDVTDGDEPVVLVYRRSTRLSSGESAVEVGFRYSSGDMPLDQRQLYSLDGSTMYVLTVTTPDGYRAVGNQIIGSFHLTPT